MRKGVKKFAPFILFIIICFLWLAPLNFCLGIFLEKHKKPIGDETSFRSTIVLAFASLMGYTIIR